MPSCRRCCQAAYAARVDEDIDPYNLLRTSIPGGDHLHRTRRGGYQPPGEGRLRGRLMKKHRWTPEGIHRCGVNTVFPYCSSSRQKTRVKSATVTTMPMTMK